MDATLKRHFLRLFDTGHRHQEMTQMLQCTYCGNRMQQAQRDFERFKKEHPDKFGVQMPQAPDSAKIQNMRDQLEQRIRTDSRYRKHLDILERGTPEEKRKEWHKENYYATN